MPEVLSNSPYELVFKNFHDCNAQRPSHTLIFRHNGLSWRIKVSVEGSLPTAITDLGYMLRRSTFRAFLEAIDFGRFQLLDNTVSGITLTLTEESHHSLPIQAMSHDAGNFYLAVSDRMRYKVEEDPNRVIYPHVSQIQYCLRTFDISCLHSGDFIAPAVSAVIVEEKKYAYKIIDRPLYEPRDTQDILDEIYALAQFHGQPNIAQIVGLVVSGNPYQTNPSNNMPRVGRALRQLHEKKRSHLDVKPSNIVLDAEGNAFLIDIGGAGSYTWDWLSPEMRLFLEQNYDQTPVNADFCVQIATDSWAYGKVLSVIAKESGPDLVHEKLREVGYDLTKAALESRIDIGAALEYLETIGEKASL
ncbi:hypothetical protein N7466_009751 [Penicillium verhagenii]|uniref:uncharacterized protein n=1 Tax=Penicillium verhagenii TaxID=1562060 RepID=UPI002544F0DB|nr:uncharacterized protein N7466_009751 [Penicillium verhagenii]KAJ5921425.1 hypothetical protein N7466_009751 [Penicillium verhagenii]